MISVDWDLSAKEWVAPPTQRGLAWFVREERQLLLPGVQVLVEKTQSNKWC